MSHLDPIEFETLAKAMLPLAEQFARASNDTFLLFFIKLAWLALEEHQRPCELVRVYTQYPQLKAVRNQLIKN